ncbi:UNVERIFIED_ORG: hypothetical protein FNL38_104275 [Nocardia globerula]|uniref:Uncharacterized protein n=1 Tax=Nocardia globerula TaxID=1818 RepID=A0A652YP94_NOCGL|nr:hypothetical protein SZ00_02036 [Rhodococcus sp. AD45]PVX68312.1 hypothetical protein C8E04_5696 [Rhodococcus globerulus]
MLRSRNAPVIGADVSEDDSPTRNAPVSTRGEAPGG